MVNPWKRLEEQNLAQMKPIVHNPSGKMDEEWERHLSKLCEVPEGVDPFAPTEDTISIDFKEPVTTAE